MSYLAPFKFSDNPVGNSFAGGWTPDTWRSHYIAQSPTYLNCSDLKKSEEILKGQPGLVPLYEVKTLNNRLSHLLQTKGFVVQAGECVETFELLKENYIPATYNLLTDIYEIISPSVGDNLLMLGRMAGQLAKPRTQLWESIKGEIVPSFQGDLINGRDLGSRKPDPLRLEKGYEFSKEALSYLKGISRKPITHGISPLKVGENLFTSHEAYLLPYEQALCRQELGSNGAWYSTSAHSLWIGERTRQANGAHVAFAKGLINPIGVKIGPTITCGELKSLIDALDISSKSLRHLCIIARFGARMIGRVLPPLLESTRNLPVLWMCDPMHGNTRYLSNGFKTRNFSDICYELRQFFKILREYGVHPYGLHCEITAMGISECWDEKRGIDLKEIERNHRSACDPRLNKEQTLELAELCGRLIEGHAS